MSNDNVIVRAKMLDGAAPPLGASGARLELGWARVLDGSATDLPAEMRVVVDLAEWFDDALEVPQRLLQLLIRRHVLPAGREVRLRLPPDPFRHLRLDGVYDQPGVRLTGDDTVSVRLFPSMGHLISQVMRGPLGYGRPPEERPAVREMWSGRLETTRHPQEAAVRLIRAGVPPVARYHSEAMGVAATPTACAMMGAVAKLRCLGHLGDVADSYSAWVARSVRAVVEREGQRIEWHREPASGDAWRELAELVAETEDETLAITLARQSPEVVAVERFTADVSPSERTQEPTTGSVDDPKAAAQRVRQAASTLREILEEAPTVRPLSATMPAIRTAFFELLAERHALAFSAGEFEASVAAAATARLEEADEALAEFGHLFAAYEAARGRAAEHLAPDLREACWWWSGRTVDRDTEDGDDGSWGDPLDELARLDSGGEAAGREEITDLELFAWLGDALPERRMAEVAAALDADEALAAPLAPLQEKQARRTARKAGRARGSMSLVRRLPNAVGWGLAAAEGARDPTVGGEVSEQRGVTLRMIEEPTEQGDASELVLSLTLDRRVHADSVTLDDLVVADAEGALLPTSERPVLPPSTGTRRVVAVRPPAGLIEVRCLGGQVVFPVDLAGADD